MPDSSSIANGIFRSFIPALAALFLLSVTSPPTIQAQEEGAPVKAIPFTPKAVPLGEKEVPKSSKKKKPALVPSDPAPAPVEPKVEPQPMSPVPPKPAATEPEPKPMPAPTSEPTPKSEPESDPKAEPDPEAEKREAELKAHGQQIAALATAAGARKSFAKRIEASAIENLRAKENGPVISLRKTKDADRVLARLEASVSEHGFEPTQAPWSHYREQLKTVETTDQASDLLLAAFLHSGLVLHEGLADGESFWDSWDDGDTPGETSKTVAWEAWSKNLGATTISEDSVSGLLAGIAPSTAIYETLRKAYLRYRKEWAGAEWPPIPDLTKSISVGDPYEHADLLSERLAMEGYYSKPAPPASDAEPAETEPAVEPVAEEPTEDPAEAGAVVEELVEAAPSIYTAELAAALEEFQFNHGLEEDGVLGRNSLAALNRSPAERLNKLRVNLERTRWLPDQFGKRFVIVNVPSGMLRAFEKDKPTVSMRIVYGNGSLGRTTPVIRDRIEYVIFRPYWNVPQGIAINELLPKFERDPNYFYDNGYELVESFSPSAQAYRIDRRSIAALQAGDLHVRQRSGGSNALGKVKFIFPNDKNVYLHDTPEKSLFQRHDRGFSHGCIRLEKPDLFATYVLGWSMDEVHNAMNSYQRRSVTVEGDLPVFIVYFTAEMTEDGKIRFFEDVYGRDPEIAKELEGHIQFASS